MLGSVAFGSLLSGVGQLGQDLIEGQCFSPKNLAGRALNEAFWSLPGNMFGTAAAMRFAKNGMSPFAAIAGSYVVGWGANFGVQQARPHIQDIYK